MTICLAMICKNESAYIRAALQSVKPYITHWSVFDTGSTDGTQDIIREEMAGLPGTLTEGAWEGWDKSRTRSIDLAKKSGCDWILLLDADETISGEIPTTLDPDAEYWVTIQFGGITYTRPNLLSSRFKYEYRGVTHEALWCIGEV